MAEILINLSWVAFAVSFIFLVISVILFVRLRITDIVNDLSGKTAKRNIQRIREENAHNEGRRSVYNPLISNSRQRVTEELEDKNNNDSIQESEETTLLENNSMETTLLSDDSALTVYERDYEPDERIDFIEDVVVIHSREIIPQMG